MKNCIHLLLIFLSLNSTAQRNLAVQALNKYVDYCNLTNNYLRILQPELDRFNDAIDYIVRKNRQKDEWGNLNNEDILNNPDYWEIFPKTVYNECMTFSKYLLTAEKNLLNTKISNIRNIIFSIDRHYKDSITYFVTKKVYLQDFNHSYIILKNIEKLYAKYDSARADMAVTLQKIYDAKYKIPATDYLQSIDKTRPAVQLCQKISDDLAREDTTQIANDVLKLDSMVAVLIKNKPKYLTGMPNNKFGEHDGANPHFRYDFLTDELKKFVSDCRSFLKSRTYPYAEWYTKCYYYYNERFAGTYSLTEAYNILNILVTGDKFFEIKMDVLGDKAGFASLRDFQYRSVGLVVPERYVLRWIGKPRIFRLRKNKN